MSPLNPLPERPWVASCLTCGHEQRSATRSGAVVLAEHHRATSARPGRPRHSTRVAHRPLGGDPTDQRTVTE